MIHGAQKYEQCLYSGGKHEGFENSGEPGVERTSRNRTASRKALIAKAPEKHVGST